jgi:hypothetical protein
LKIFRVADDADDFASSAGEERLKLKLAPNLALLVGPGNADGLEV